MKKFPQTFADFVEEQFPLFQKVLECPNPPNEEGAMRDLVDAQLKEMGAITKTDTIGNLIGSFGEATGDSPAFMLGAHLDAVEPCRGIKVKREGDILKSAGETILSADDGAGIFEILAAIAYLQANNIAMPPLDVLFTVGEEIGGVGVNALNIADLRATKGLLIDRADDPGAFVIAGPFKRNFKVCFKGTAAHAFEAEKGVSAIHMAAAAVSQFPQGKINEGLYANIGKLNAGNAVNQVAEEACLEGEVRAYKLEEAEGLLDQYKRIIDSIVYQFSASGEHQPTAEISYTARREGYHHDMDSPMVKLLQDVHEEIGMTSDMQVTRACSDAGDLTNKGIATINYANGAHKVHTKDEWIDMNDVIQVSWALVKILEKLGKEPGCLGE